MLLFILPTSSAPLKRSTFLFSSSSSPFSLKMDVSLEDGRGSTGAPCAHHAANPRAMSIMYKYTFRRPKLASLKTADYLKLLGMGHIFLGILAFLVQICGMCLCLFSPIAPISHSSHLSHSSPSITI